MEQPSPLTYLIQFDEGDIAHLKLITETPDTLFYSIRKNSTDIELNEKTTLTISIKLSKLTTEEIKREQDYKMFKEGAEEKINKQKNGDS